MQFASAIFAGVAASAIFWAVDKYLLPLPAPWQLGGIVACFTVFAGAGYWLAVRKPDQTAAPVGTRIATGLKGRNIKINVRDVVTGGDMAEIVSNVTAAEKIEANVTNVKANH